jgi:hypothetical protein
LFGVHKKQNTFNLFEQIQKKHYLTLHCTSFHSGYSIAQVKLPIRSLIPTSRTPSNPGSTEKILPGLPRHA